MPYVFNSVPATDNDWHVFNQVIGHEGAASRRLPTDHTLWQKWIDEVGIDTGFAALPNATRWREFLIEQGYI